MACTATPNITTSTYSSWCPAASRRVLAVDDVVIQGTTLEVGVKADADPQRVADMYDVFLLLVVAFAGVWGIKALRNVFDSHADRD